MNTNRLMMVVSVAGALTLAACGSDSKAASSSTRPTSSTSPTSSTGAASTAATSIKVSTTTSRGDILVDGSGRTLYLFEKDSGTTSACTGGCAAVWPVLSAAGTVTASTGVDAAKLGSAHGQVTYNGHLLYYFSGDAAPGDMKGVDIEEWYPVTPDGGSAEPK